MVLGRHRGQTQIFAFTSVNLSSVFKVTVTAGISLLYPDRLSPKINTPQGLQVNLTGRTFYLSNFIFLFIYFWFSFCFYWLRIEHLSPLTEGKADSLFMSVSFSWCHVSGCLTPQAKEILSVVYLDTRVKGHMAWLISQEWVKEELIIFCFLFLFFAIMQKMNKIKTYLCCNSPSVNCDNICLSLI